MKKSIAIIKGDMDLARVITMNHNDSYYEVKVILFVDSYYIETFKAFESKPDYFLINKNSSEITYHISTDVKSNKYHLKIDGVYETLVDGNLIDLNEELYIPVPVFKFTFPKDITSERKYKEKKSHSVIDVSDRNIFELYITHENNLSQKGLKTGFMSLESLFPLEFFITNTFPKEDVKLEYHKYLAEKGPQRHPVLMLTNNIKVRSFVYEDNNPEINKTLITIGENKYSRAVYLLLSQENEMVYPISPDLIKVYRKSPINRPIFYFERMLTRMGGLTSQEKYRIKKDGQRALKEVRDIFEEKGIKGNNMFK